MRYQFLIDTYRTEILKVLSVWSMFHDQDLPFRPHPTDHRGRSVLEQMVHQCISEDLWFKNMLAISVVGEILPDPETRWHFLHRYAEHAHQRLAALETKSDDWWESDVLFFNEHRPKTWIMVRRIAHTAHHRGQQTTMLRMLGRDLHSTYGPTADTGGLMRDHAPVIYAYANEEELLAGELSSGEKASLDKMVGRIVTERPQG
jgi:uncharacterized damage-inducible protein DinB